MGGFGAAMLRMRGWRRMAAGTAIGLGGLLSLMYCVGLDLEFVQDTRYDVERWFAPNAQHVTVVSFENRYLWPRTRYGGVTV